MESRTIDQLLGIDLSDQSLTDDEILEGLHRIRRLTRRWWTNEERAAATLAINLTTTPFDVRERLLGLLLLLSETPPAAWNRQFGAVGADIVGVEPRLAFLQLIDRERTYLSNVPVHTPVARLCRAMVRRGILDRVAPLNDAAAILRVLHEQSLETSRGQLRA